MSDNTSHLREQRDSFIAFSLAAADLLLELRGDHTICQVIGAVRSLLALNEGEVLGQSLEVFFQEPERSFLRGLLETARYAGRVDPSLLRVELRSGVPMAVSIGATFLPKIDRFYVSITLLPDLILDTLPERNAVTGLLEYDEFQSILETRTIAAASRPGADLQLLHFEGLPNQIGRLPSERKQAVMSEIGALLRTLAAENGMAAQLDADKFGLLTKAADARQLMDIVQSRLETMFQFEGLDLSGVSVAAEKIPLDIAGMDATGAARALAHALKSFAESGHVGAASLSDCLANAVATTSGNLARLRQTIDNGEFDLHYQPVVDLNTRAIHHYEALLRLQDGSSPFDTVTFSEDVGLCCDLDLAILSRALATLKDNPSQSLAVNLSGMSLQSANFSSRLLALLARDPQIGKRLSLEITESALISHFEGPVAVINALRTKGFSVCLDDFGAGSAAYNYLRKFDVDYVKIDGAFVAGAQDDRRERSLLKSLAVLCRELKTEVIAEMVETEKSAVLMRSLGIGYAQGFLFGKPVSTLANPAVNGRRKGERETWS